jgi:hypothetical protein
VGGFGKTMSYLNAACLFFIIHLWLYWKIQVFSWFGITVVTEWICDTLPAHSHFSVTRKEMKYVWRPSERSQLEYDLGLAFFTGVFFSSNLWNFTRVPNITVRLLRKTSFAIECLEIINYVQDALLVRRIFLKSIGLFVVKFKAETWLCHCMC